jgi:dihydropteroate synthase
MRKLRVEDTYFPANKHIRLKDKLFDLTNPKIMGILNCTPDSFHIKSRIEDKKDLSAKIEAFITEGIDIFDIGGYSSRPGAFEVSVSEEINRVLPVIQHLKKEFPSFPISLDTFRSEVAKIGLENGVEIINDISAWEIDNELLNVISHYKCPYILMHMKGIPSTMQNDTIYENLFNTIASFFSEKINILEANGINDIILDPGFGFGKTLEQNHELLNKLDQFKIFEKPILSGISRKSMIYNKLNSSPKEALNGTTVLNTLSILKGASILRVHDVKEAKEVLKLLDF